MTALAASFLQQGYVPLPGLVGPSAAAFLYDYAVKLAAAGRMHSGDNNVPGAPAAYADPLMEMLLDKLTPRVEEASGLSLHPTYSYFRIYGRGHSLERHQDRPSCEVSVTLSVGFEADRPWPIWVEGPAGSVPVSLERGDGLLYRGIDCPHWREPFDGDRAVQVFLHWVDRHGPYAEWKFDKRDSLSPFPAHLKSLFRF